MVTELVALFSERFSVPFTVVKVATKAMRVQLVLQNEADVVPLIRGTEVQKKVLDFTSVYLEDSIPSLPMRTCPSSPMSKDLSGKLVGVLDAKLFESVRQLPEHKISTVDGLCGKCVDPTLLGKIEALLLPAFRRPLTVSGSWG